MHRTYVVSNYSREILRKKGADMSRVAISYPSIDLDKYQPLPNRRELSNVFVYASSCTVWKGIEDIINAMRLLKKKRSDFRVIMFSPGISNKLTWTSDSKFSRMIHDYGLSENHELINEPRSDIGHVMAHSRSVIAPFRSMLGTLDIPLSLLEGMAVGVPVIGSTIGGIPEVVQDGENGLLVQPQEPQQLADAMFKLLSDDDLCRRMGTRGREIVQGFSVNKVAVGLIEDYTRN
jgi:glycosyltransferase involved in cell wall biosynthesis